MHMGDMNVLFSLVHICVEQVGETRAKNNERKIAMKLMKLLSATCAGVMAAASAQAATQGIAGPTSTGTLAVTMDILEEVKISNLADIALGQYVPGGGDLTGTSPVCVYYNNANQYDITPTSANSAGPGYQLNLGADNVAYTGEFQNDRVGAGAFTAFNETTVYTVNTATTTDDDCVTATDSTSTLRVRVTDTGSPLPVANGSYSDTITLVVVPNP